jgi:hypothetical protein
MCQTFGGIQKAEVANKIEDFCDMCLAARPKRGRHGSFETIVAAPSIRRHAAYGKEDDDLKLTVNLYGCILQPIRKQQGMNGTRGL